MSFVPRLKPRRPKQGLRSATPLYLEKAIERPRHIEIQVFGDKHGNVVHLGERECSIQRRHRSDRGVSFADQRSGVARRMGEAAVKIGQTVSYTGAGTVEFCSQTRRMSFTSSR